MERSREMLRKEIKKRKGELIDAQMVIGELEEQYIQRCDELADFYAAQQKECQLKAMGLMKEYRRFMNGTSRSFEGIVCLLSESPQPIHVKFDRALPDVDTFAGYMAAAAPIMGEMATDLSRHVAYLERLKGYNSKFNRQLDDWRRNHLIPYKKEIERLRNAVATMECDDLATFDDDTGDDIESRVRSLAEDGDAPERIRQYESTLKLMMDDPSGSVA